MRRSEGSASEAGDVEVRFARAPVDRLFVGCIVVLLLVYGGWLLVIRSWRGEPQVEARQGFHGFVTGSSQPPAGAGEASPAAAGEFGSSKLGISRYFGGATPRPIAEGARVVASEELPEPAKPAEPAKLPEPAKPAKSELSQARESPAAARTAAKSESGSGEPSEPPEIGRLGLGEVVKRWLGSYELDALDE
ncbi:MAG: hypothetical protein R6X02_07370 [Enhygromyxa sp.]